MILLRIYMSISTLWDATYFLNLPRSLGIEVENILGKLVISETRGLVFYA